MRKLIFLAFCFALFLVRAPLACALDLEKFDHLVVFGDSLSDNGNFFAITEAEGTMPPQPPFPPYGETFDGTGRVFLGRFTDGQNWVDYFPGVAEHFDVHISAVTAYLRDPNNSNDKATDFAIGGSTSGDVNVLNGALPSFPAQIGAYLARLGGRSAADDLCVIWIGANDFAAGIDPLKTVANIKSGIVQLLGAGAKNFAVITIPDLSLTPRVKALGGATILGAKRFVFTANALLEVELLRFAFLHGINIELVDINRLFIPLVLIPGRFGFTNSTTPALAALAANPSTDPNDYLFFDDFHPTTRAHLFAAEFIYRSIAFRRDFPETPRVPLAKSDLSALIGPR
jgi:phospholipase/lecithinase/hemolysin